MATHSRERGDALSPPTLLISAVASGAAAIVVPLFWENGSLVAAAITPVVISLVREALQRPVDRIGAATSNARGTEQDRSADRARPAATRRGRPWMKIALITGLLAFAIAAVVLTVSELAGGDSVTGEDRTTLFGGEKSAPPQSEDTPTETVPPETVPTATVPAETVPTETTPTETTPTTPSEPVPTETTPTQTTPTEPAPAPGPAEPATPPTPPRPTEPVP